jgi:hypothetical protein
VDTVLELDRLTRRYGDVVPSDDLSFTVGEGFKLLVGVGCTRDQAWLIVRSLSWILLVAATT